MPAGRRGRQRGIQLVCRRDLKPGLWRQPVWGLLFLHGNLSSAFPRPPGKWTSIPAAKLSEQIRLWDTLACFWDVKQPTNKQSSANPRLYHTNMMIMMTMVATVVVMAVVMGVKWWWWLCGEVGDDHGNSGDDSDNDDGGSGDDDPHRASPVSVQLLCWPRWWRWKHDDNKTDIGEKDNYGDGCIHDDGGGGGRWCEVGSYHMILPLLLLQLPLLLLLFVVVVAADGFVAVRGGVPVVVAAAEGGGENSSSCSSSSHFYHYHYRHHPHHLSHNHHNYHFQHYRVYRYNCYTCPNGQLHHGQVHLHMPSTAAPAVLHGAEGSDHYCCPGVLGTRAQRSPRLLLHIACWMAWVRSTSWGKACVSVCMRACVCVCVCVCMCV